MITRSTSVCWLVNFNHNPFISKPVNLCDLAVDCLSYDVTLISYTYFRHKNVNIDSERQQKQTTKKKQLINLIAVECIAHTHTHAYTFSHKSGQSSLLFISKSIFMTICWSTGQVSLLRNHFLLYLSDSKSIQLESKIEIMLIRIKPVTQRSLAL